jgi:hypothetical protein
LSRRARIRPVNRGMVNSGSIMKIESRVKGVSVNGHKIWVPYVVGRSTRMWVKKMKNDMMLHLTQPISKDL